MRLLWVVLAIACLCGESDAVSTLRRTGLEAKRGAHSPSELRDLKKGALSKRWEAEYVKQQAAAAAPIDSGGKHTAAQASSAVAASVASTLAAAKGSKWLRAPYNTPRARNYLLHCRHGNADAKKKKHTAVFDCASVSAQDAQLFEEYGRTLDAIKDPPTASWQTFQLDEVHNPPPVSSSRGGVSARRHSGKSFLQVSATARRARAAAGAAAQAQTEVEVAADAAAELAYTVKWPWSVIAYCVDPTALTDVELYQHTEMGLWMAAQVLYGVDRIMRAVEYLDQYLGLHQQPASGLPAVSVRFVEVLCTAPGFKIKFHNNGRGASSYVGFRGGNQPNSALLDHLTKCQQDPNCVANDPLGLWAPHHHLLNGPHPYAATSQAIQWDPTSDFPSAAVAHELMHALGFKHMHQRHDRDNYVTINSKGTIVGAIFLPTCRQPHPHGGTFDCCTNYVWKAPAPTTPLAIAVASTPYDYNSIMHYSVGRNPNGPPNPCLYDASLGAAARTIMYRQPPVGVAPGVFSLTDPVTHPHPGTDDMGDQDRLAAGDISALNVLYPAVTW